MTGSDAGSDTGAVDDTYTVPSIESELLTFGHFMVNLCDVDATDITAALDVVEVEGVTVEIPTVHIRAASAHRVSRLVQMLHLIQGDTDYAWVGWAHSADGTDALSMGVTVPDPPDGRLASPIGPTLVACDIDGTLLRTGRPIADAVCDAVSAVRAAGHHLVLATGRSLAGALPVAEQLRLDDGWIVASNGAVTARIASGGYEVVEQHVVNAEAAVRLAVAAAPGVRIAAEIVGIGYRVNIPFPDGELNGIRHNITGLEELWATPTPRLALHGPGIDRTVPALRALGLTAIPTRSDWVDVTPADLSKATALEKVRTELGVEDYATVAIGDGENDLQMLMWATTAFSMGHAPMPVIAAADHVTGTIDQDGAAAALRSLLT